MKHLNTIILIIIAIILGWILFDKPEPNTIEVIKERIKLEKDTIHHYEKEIVRSYANNSHLESQISELMDSLEVYKIKKDTVRIIVTQSKSIVKLQNSNDTLKTIISYKDSTIIKKDVIIESQDTIISQQANTIEQKEKVLKRLKNGLFAAIGVVAVVVIDRVVK